MEIKIVNEQGMVDQPQPTPVSEPTENISSPINLDVLGLAQMFDMDFKEAKKENEKLETLVKWAKTQVDEPTLQNIKLAIRNLESRVGSPGLTENRLTKIHRFAFLELQEQKLRAEKEMLYVN